jgi:hypothetical protein
MILDSSLGRRLATPALYFQGQNASLERRYPPQSEPRNKFCENQGSIKIFQLFCQTFNQK